MTLSGNVGPTSLTFALAVPSTQLTNLSLQNPAPQTGTLSIEPAGGDSYLIRISAVPGQVLSRAQPLGQLEFTAVPGQVSAFVPLRLSNLSADQANGEPVPKPLTHDGRVAVIGLAPLVEALLSANEARTVVLYGTPGKNYAVERATNQVNAPWTLFGQSRLTNQFQRFDAGRTNQTWFYRAREQ